MFRTRASFQLGLKSILYLLALVFNETVSSTARFEYGCSFANDKYNYNKKWNTKKQLPEWSRLGMESYAVYNFEEIGKRFEKLFIEASILNELSLFTEFVEQYRKKNSASFFTINFETFFNNYVVRFEPKKYCDNTNNTIRKTRDPASYLIQELQALKSNFNSTTKENPFVPYLVSAYIDPKWHVFQNIEKLLQKPVQDHLAAIINIIYSGNRTGYILIDPGYVNGQKLYQPFVVYVMKDGQPPHGDILRGPEKKSNTSIEILVGDDGKGNPFILAKHNLSPNTVRHVLYYVGKPYCSFMENTIKANLMRPYHGIIQRDSKGDPQAYLRFKLTLETKCFEKTLFREKTTSGEKTENTKHVTISRTIDKIEDYFLVSEREGSDIRKELKIIKDNVFGKSNSQFLAELINQTKTLGLTESGAGEEPVRSQNFFQKLISCININ
uniref:Secreted protein n=1 Tax=Cacopsylla melanoneura TaxID=428564 RepID=A0A8D8WES7_9HEMI